MCWKASDLPTLQGRTVRGTGRGAVDLTLASRSGRTRIVERWATWPLAIQRALYLDDRLRDMAFVMLVNPGPGILQGDHQTIRVEVKANARAHVTNQSATKLHRMPDSGAAVQTTLIVGDGAHLEYLPEPVIPFAGTRITQQTRITVASSGTLFFWEITAPGRVAFGESLEYEHLRNDLTISRPDGQALCREAFLLQPRLRSLRSAVVAGPVDHPTLGSLWIVSSRPDAAVLRDRLREAPIPDGARVGITTLPFDAGVGVKVIGPQLQVVKSILTSLAARARDLALGSPLTLCRK